MLPIQYSARPPKLFAQLNVIHFGSSANLPKCLTWPLFATQATRATPSEDESRRLRGDRSIIKNILSWQIHLALPSPTRESLKIAPSPLIKQIIKWTRKLPLHRSLASIPSVGSESIKCTRSRAGAAAVGCMRAPVWVTKSLIVQEQGNNRGVPPIRVSGRVGLNPFSTISLLTTLSINCWKVTDFARK